MNVDRRIVAGIAAGLVVVSAGVAWAVRPTPEAERVRQLADVVARGSLTDRQEALWRLGSVGGPVAAQTAAHALRTDTDPDIREAAAYALQKMKSVDHIELLRVAAAKEPSPEVQVKMAVYVSRLGGDRVASWLSQVGDGPLSWLGLGATLARLERLDLNADGSLYRYLRSSNRAMSDLAVRGLTPWVRLMSEAIGRHVSLPDAPDDEITPGQADDLAKWWQRFVTVKLMKDNVLWAKDRDPRWHRIKRLMRARGKAIGFLEVDPTANR